MNNAALKGMREMWQEVSKPSTSGVQLVEGVYKAGDKMTAEDWQQLATLKLMASYEGFRRSGMKHDAAKEQALSGSCAGHTIKTKFVEVVDAHPQDWQW